MKNSIYKSSLLTFFMLVFSVAFAQLELPRPSPNASVSQTVGVTNITIDYSSPGVKGRVIWGKLVPYDKIWRAGANSPTKITFSEDVMMEGTNIPAGSYSILVKPSKNGDWNININKDPKVFYQNHDPNKDIVVIKTKPSESPFMERLMYYFSDFDDNSTKVNLAWEKKAVSFKVDVATSKHAEKNIDKAVGNVTSMYTGSANYYFSNKKYDKALKHIERAINNQKNWFNIWMKARILKEQGKIKQAVMYAKKSKELGEKAKNFFFKEDVENAIKTWK